jgi:hypothetical protein
MPSLLRAEGDAGAGDLAFYRSVFSAHQPQHGPLPKRVIAECLERDAGWHASSPNIGREKSYICAYSVRKGDRQVRRDAQEVARLAQSTRFIPSNLNTATDE